MISIEIRSWLKPPRVGQIPDWSVRDRVGQLSDLGSCRVGRLSEP